MTGDNPTEDTMGTTSTRKRVLDKDLMTRVTGLQSNGSTYVNEVPAEGTATTQETTSFRTGFAEDPLSPEARAEFTDVTRNGFTETNPRYDSGHPFFTTKTWVTASHPRWKSYRMPGGGLKETFTGPLVPAVPFSSTTNPFPVIPRLTSTEINTFGAKAIKGTIPTQSSASLAVFLGEAISALPSIVGASMFQTKTEYFSSLGSEYLNVQFGWLPFIDDLRKTVSAISNSCKIIRQYHRDSGRVVRRRLTFPPIVADISSTTYTPSVGSSIVGMPLQWAYGTFPWTDILQPILREQNSVQHYSFSGAYSYLLNTDDTVIGRIERIEQEANRLLGTRLTPSVLWELAPWSWLTDWVWNVGDIVANASYLGADGLVMRYGYLMRHTIAYNRHSIVKGIRLQGDLRSGPINVVYGRETKERVKGTPYGFGISPGALSTKQWAILGALGLTKGSNVLP